MHQFKNYVTESDKGPRLAEDQFSKIGKRLILDIDISNSDNDVAGFHLKQDDESVLIIEFIKEFVKLPDCSAMQIRPLLFPSR